MAAEQQLLPYRRAEDRPERQQNADSRRGLAHGAEQFMLGGVNVTEMIVNRLENRASSKHQGEHDQTADQSRADSHRKSLGPQPQLPKDAPPADAAIGKQREHESDEKWRRGQDRDVARPKRKLGGRLSLCCLLYTSDAADDLLWVDLGGSRNIQ